MALGPHPCGLGPCISRLCLPGDEVALNGLQPGRPQAVELEVISGPGVAVDDNGRAFATAAGVLRCPTAFPSEMAWWQVGG